MSKVLAELRQTVRTLRRSPGFAAVAIVSLGLSLGATTAVFSMINAVAVLATYVPARRAARVEPVRALRAE